MEFDLAVRGFRLEIRGHCANLKSHFDLMSFSKDEIRCPIIGEGEAERNGPGKRIKSFSSPTDS
jgi:hypothetical protein